VVRLHHPIFYSGLHIQNPAITFKTNSVMKKLHRLIGFLFALLLGLQTRAGDIDISQATVTYAEGEFIISNIVAPQDNDEAGLRYVIITGDGNYISDHIWPLQKGTIAIPYGYRSAGNYTFQVRLTKTYSSGGPRTKSIDGGLARAAAGVYMPTSQKAILVAHPNDAVAGDNTTLILKLSKRDGVLTSSNPDVQYRLVGSKITMSPPVNGVTSLRNDAQLEYAFVEVLMPDRLDEQTLLLTLQNELGKSYTLPLAVLGAHDPNNLAVYPLCNTLKSSHGYKQMKFSFLINFENTGLGPERDIDITFNKHPGIIWPAAINFTPIVYAGNKQISAGGPGSSFKVIDMGTKWLIRLANVDVKGQNTAAAGSPQTKGYVSFNLDSRYFLPNANQKILFMRAAIAFGSAMPKEIIYTNTQSYTGASAIAFCNVRPSSAKPAYNQTDTKKPGKKKTKG